MTAYVVTCTLLVLKHTRYVLFILSYQRKLKRRIAKKKKNSITVNTMLYMYISSLTRHFEIFDSHIVKMMPVSICSFLLSSYVLSNYVVTMSVVSTATQTTVSAENTSTPALDSNEQRIADIIVMLHMIGSPPEAEAAIRMDVEKKIRDENITELSQVFTKAEFNKFCTIWPNE